MYLAPRLDLVDLEEASVVEAVDTGLSQGRQNFHAVVFSVLDFVLIQVHTAKDGKLIVERSDLMNLFLFNDKNSHFVHEPRFQNPGDSETVTGLFECCC